MSAQQEHSDTIRVASYLPFWRWAVAMRERPDLPAIPFWREASARRLANEARKEFPNRTTLLVKRSFLCGDVEIAEVIS